MKLTEVSFGKLAVSLSRDNIEEEGGSLMKVQNKAPEIRLSAQMVDNTHLIHDVRTPRHFDKTKQRNQSPAPLASFSSVEVRTVECYGRMSHWIF